MYSRHRTIEAPFQALMVGLPAGLYTTTLCCYIAYQGSAEPFWFRAGFVSNVMGMGVALMAAVPGLLDWLLGSSARTPGRNLALNVCGLLVFTANAWIHDGNWDTTPSSVTLGIALAAIGLTCIAAGGWMGWESAGRTVERVERATKPVPVEYFEERRPAA
jgi:uncharacterized membrane protein